MAGRDGRAGDQAGGAAGIVLKRGGGKQGSPVRGLVAEAVASSGSSSELWGSIVMYDGGRPGVLGGGIFRGLLDIVVCVKFGI